MPSVTLTLLPDIERLLRVKANSAGLTLERYLDRLVEYDASNGPSNRKSSFDEVVAPVRSLSQENPFHCRVESQAGNGAKVLCDPGRLALF